mgnify:CR=1 FL=1
MPAISTKIKHYIERVLKCKIYRGWYPRGTNLIFDLKRLIIAKSPVILDVGANIGQIALELADEYPMSQIHACEPNKETIDGLIKNTKNVRQIICHRVALGSETGEANMHLYEGTVNNSLKAISGQGSRGSECVSVTTLDAFCKAQEIEKIDYLKIDTEGFDLEVVQGGLELFKEKRILVLLAEVGFSSQNTKHVKFAQFLEMMHECNMSLFGIYDQRREFDGTNALRRADCLFIANDYEFPGLANAPDC